MDDSTPKYLNSPESAIFEKGNYYLPLIRLINLFVKNNKLSLPEGYMDVISAHNHGVTNVVASLGTAYTRDHGHILMRQAEEIVLAYDMDGAGRQAAARGYRIIAKYGF